MKHWVYEAKRLERQARIDKAIEFCGSAVALVALMVLIVGGMLL